MKSNGEDLVFYLQCTEQVRNGCLRSLRPADIVRLFSMLRIKGTVSGTSEISKDLKKSLKDEIFKIIQKCKKGQNEINKCLIKCLQNVIRCQIHLVLNLEFVKFLLKSHLSARFYHFAK